LIFLLLLIQVLINFLGALSPELSFDALWYHLTPPKLYVQYQQIFHLPGWLLSVSSLPRLTEMFYTAALTFGNEIWAKLIHFLFGLGCLWALFNLLKRYFSVRITLLGVLTFYTMLIVGWQSTVAYVDLTWTFFEILALDSFLRWYEEKKESFLNQSAILMGLAIATKILAFASLFGYLVMILILRRRDWLKSCLKFGFLALLVVSPWLILSWVNVGNPFFPFLGSPNDVRAVNVQPSTYWFVSKIVNFPFLLWQATFSPDDIISPIYLLFLPLVLLIIWKQKPSFKIVGLYCLLGSFLVPIESNRYLLPYLAALTLPLLTIFSYSWQKKKLLTNVFIIIIILSVLLNLGSRGLATQKFISYLLGQETKAEFLTKNLNFSFGDFYDVDGYFKDNIQPQDLVLIYGIHNLYYVDFPYVHESWAKPGTYFTHILVAGEERLPEKFGEPILQYQNPKTGVRLYLFGKEYQ
jgi:4-amino-4-deoxy-L-arabinose transferase-like glycosyltransferase